MRRLLLVLITMVVTLAAVALPAYADGAPVIRQRDVWEALEEGQQIAVVALGADGAVGTDLFISLIDHSGVPHEVTFFLPLGWDASGFTVVEEDSSDFEGLLTAPLDERLKQAVVSERYYERDLRFSLLAGSWVISGSWTWPLMAMFALSACASDAPQPLDVLHTESSQVSIYGIDEDTDLAALIATTGLDPSVQATLRMFEGQQIAVVNMRTQAPPGGDTSGYYQREAESQRGLHLSWNSQAADRGDGGWEHRYPLGTGGAWARPIPLTRVYVTAPAGLGFRVEYPSYGQDLSDTYTRAWYSRVAQYRMFSERDETAFAVVQRTTPQGQLWRGVYTQANPSEDLRIVRDAAAEEAAREAVSNLRLRTWTSRWSWVFSVVVAAAAWVVCWRYVMSRRLGISYRWNQGTLWRDALTYPVANSLILGVLYVLVSSLGKLENLFIWLLIAVIAAAAVVLPLPLSSMLFARAHEQKKAEATKGFWIVAALANACHLTVGAIYVVALGHLLG
jgi:hypothetical protein